MVPWEKILCCSELDCLPHNPRYHCIPPTAESMKHLDFILHQGDQFAEKDDSKTPLKFKDHKYHEAIISVVRFGDISDEHWPVRYFAAWSKVDGTLGGFIEIGEEKMKTAEIQEIIGDTKQSRHDRFLGQCPNHPNLEFYIRFHPLKEKPMFVWEKDPKEKNKQYPWEEGRIQPEVSNKIFKKWGDIDLDSDNCPLPLLSYSTNGTRTTTRWEPLEGKGDSITKFDPDFDSWWSFMHVFAL
ncbi:hypothetical protein L207DRAFT_531860 [Hyaloscypha variabilis F]|uniref:Uncharacterized protein n=1 Tax=Hyaloscypha variabilis (strain UAMH 11265 / GT02V1 / F) TaxID=1149755 RepID=A0A2J6RGE1_HYAVF|nr:hypothetical protein L207DRAFT_531860 [Hyaloscypha variabilis F]